MLTLTVAWPGGTASTPGDSKDLCEKNGGWRSQHDAGRQSFKNRGQCVSYANHGGTFVYPGVSGATGIVHGDQL